MIPCHQKGSLSKKVQEILEICHWKSPLPTMAFGVDGLLTSTRGALHNNGSLLHLPPPASTPRSDRFSLQNPTTQMRSPERLPHTETSRQHDLGATVLALQALQSYRNTLARETFPLAGLQRDSNFQSTYGARCGRISAINSDIWGFSSQSLY